ncbi:MAG: efflux RND transporter permease subunit [Longimicrobiales bacterium]|nr:efflux RND transporter permease subunit [Longimicrobiales bacterium]
MSGQPKRSGGLSSLAIRRPVGTLTLTSVVVVLGLFFLGQLPVDLLPSIVYPQIRASVSNRGVAPEVMEETVAKPLETALATTEDLIRIETEVQEGQVGVNLLFSYGTDIDFALQDASKNLDRARSRLPEEADPPTIFKFDPSQASIFDVAFSSGERDLIALRDWVEFRLRPQLLLIEGVASVDISGGLVREVQVILDQERLRSYGLTVSQITDALRSENQDVAAGRVASQTREIVGKTTGRFRTVEEVRDVLLPLGTGERIPVSEVAEVRDTNQEQRLWTRLNGVPAVKVAVRKQPNANTVSVARTVESRITQLASSSFIPQDIEYQIIQNQADFIESSVSGVRNAALAGAGLAMLVVFLFLGSLRKTFTVGLAIPIAILATFIGMGLTDLTLNIMSLGGLALGVGLLIDNSIVMLENIFRHRDEEQLGAVDAAHVGAAEVQSAVVASTATNLAAVVPFLLISGLAALIFRELILTISFAILASLAVALTVVPTVSAQLAKLRFSSGADRLPPLVALDRTITWLRSGYRTIMFRVVAWRWAVMGAAVLLLGGTYLLVRDTGSEFLPQVDNGNVSVSISLPPGAPAEETNRVTGQVEAIVEAMPHVEAIFATAGGFIFGASTSQRSGRGGLDVVLASATEREMSADAWVRTLQTRLDSAAIPGARIFVRPPRIRGLRTSSSGSDVALSIQGDDLEELRLIGDEVVALLAGIPGLANLEPSAEESSPELAIELDRERAAFLGLDVARVGQTLRTALDGTVATRFAQGSQEYDIRVMFPRERFTSPEDVGSVALFPGGATGSAPIYLRDVANVSEVLGPTTIRRENQNRVFSITGDVIDEVASVGEVTGQIRERLATLALPEGYGIIIGGESEAIRENNRQLAIVVALAIFLVFVVMAVQYESLVNPFVILLAIPLSLVGVGLAVTVVGLPLSAPVFLGVILLAGIVVNNAILLVEYVEQGRARGLSAVDAVVQAGAVRLRPILMTTLTTAFGMLPLALGIGEGSELMRPLAVAVVGGLSLSTVLTLFVVPCAYLMLHHAVDALQAFLVGTSGNDSHRDDAGTRADDLIPSPAGGGR